MILSDLVNITNIHTRVIISDAMDKVIYKGEILKYPKYFSTAIVDFITMVIINQTPYIAIYLK